MQLPRYKAGPVDYWITEAATQFINGAIAGWKIGATVGVGSGGGLAASPAGERIGPVLNALIAVSSIALVCIASGAARFHEWHKTNELPNPFFPTKPPFTPPSP